MDATIRFPLPDISLDPDDRIWIYGTGVIAQSFFEQIVSLYGAELVKGFINSFGHPSTFMGKKVVAISDLKVDANDKYLVASRAHADIMVGMLLQRGAKSDQIVCQPDWLYFSKRDGRPVLIYQFGKVGSSSLYHSLNRLNREVYHVHVLEAGRLAAVINSLKNAGQEIPMHLATSLYLQNAIQNRKWDVISIVRDPVARNISAFFENLQRYAPSYQNHERFMKMELEEKVDSLIEDFFDNYPHDSIFHWFDAEIKVTFGLDIFSLPFDRSNGYSMYEWDGHRLLVLQFERLPELADVIRDFLGLSEFQLSKENVGETKDYGAVYKRFRERIRFDDAFLDRMYNNRFARHFYTDEAIEAFRQRWLTKP